MIIKELIKKYKITDKIPYTIQNLELDEDIKHFIEYDNPESNVYVFKGEYEPLWFEGDATLQTTITINLTPFNNEIIDNIDNIDKFLEIVPKLTSLERQEITSHETITYTQTIPNIFYAFTTYNLLGGLISIS
jgi:hypothetical protein